MLIEAAKILKSKNIEVKWYVVGAGKLSNWLDEEIKKNHLEQIVLPVGFRFNTGSIVRKMDILVHPSRFEGKSNTIDEALHYNVPVVATNFETVYEQINDGENGFIVNMDGNEISLKIEELKNNKELYQIIKSNLESSPNENVDKGKEFIETIKHIGG